MDQGLVVDTNTCNNNTGSLLSKFFANDTFVGCNERIFDTTGVYQIPLPNTIEKTLTFNVTLYFIESYFGTVGQRIFDVFIEDEMIQENLDIYNETRAKNKVYKLSSMVYVPDGLLTIELFSIKNDAKLNAIVIQPYYDWD